MRSPPPRPHTRPARTRNARTGSAARSLLTGQAAALLLSCAWFILAAGIAGEAYALIALYQMRDSPGQRFAVLVNVLLLIAAAAGPAVITYGKAFFYTSSAAITAEARADAHARDLDEEEVLRLLWTGSEGARVWALAVLQERPELATPRAVLDAIQHPDQMFDQYQALILADKFIESGTSAIWTLERVGEAAHYQLHSGKLGTDQPSIHQARQGP